MNDYKEAKAFDNFTDLLNYINKLTENPNHIYRG